MIYLIKLKIIIRQHLLVIASDSEAISTDNGLQRKTASYLAMT